MLYSRYGACDFTVMPFAVVNAPSVFMCPMHHVSQGFGCAVVYVDDACIFSNPEAALAVLNL